MSDQCKHCEAKGDISKCEDTECDLHDYWYVKQLKERTCDSCRWYNDGLCSEIDDSYTQHYGGSFCPPEDFYCNLWSPRIICKR